ncbi:GFA family protein [Comamonas sp. JC664]|uniref:GFA family protein n=1 Tax=Comamonas sp. JC664 TaxID=2801917 RepID=UPI0017480A35|nr:GFA family protein [Comamonas sp. JC664]MBL0692131.1 GFA family protein [Comamonas sp. JC664]GHG99497.1 alanine acetyltransferase [Comamonas sp. KCTC 72670]
MKIEGSCHCRGVRFSVETQHPSPFMRCYCSVCRKTQGGGGYAINLSGDARSLKVRGKQHLKVYRARIQNPEDARARKSTGQRNFCGRCGSALWLYDPTWPELIHPFASAIDTPLPEAPELVHIMLEFKPDWVPLQAGKKDKKFPRYPKESIAEWHQRHGAEVE